MRYRLGKPRWQINGGARVRVAENLRKCVVYLGLRAKPSSETEITPVGTGFMVSWEDEDDARATGVYLVTANHVAKDLGQCFVARFNTKEGAGRNFQIDDPKWERDPNADLAVQEFYPPEWADYIPILRSRFLTEQWREDQDIGAGDLVHIVGAFRLLHGEHQNLPLVHTGHVALLPEDEPIPVKGLGNIRGYLVQVQTLRGSSGSPVFVRRHVPGYARLERSPDAECWMYSDSWLLGINQGAWFGKPDEVLDLPQQNGPVEVPVSMAIIIPSERLIEMLDSQKMKDRRKLAKDQGDDWRRAEPTSDVSGALDNDANPNHLADFRRLVDVAARKRPQDD
jgi:hypothetical protein